MSVQAAVSFASTVLSYFSPTKSPFYSVIAVGTTALILSGQIGNNWNIFYYPLAILLLLTTLISIKNKPDFDLKEYNDQIKFSRAFSISAAILCFIFVGITISPSENGQNTWYFWVAYIASISQIIIFMFYIYVYANIEAKPLNKNFIQLALITSTFLIGAIYTTISHKKKLFNMDLKYLSISLVLYGLWLITISVWLIHLKQTIKFEFRLPDDAIKPVNNSNKYESETSNSNKLMDIR